MFPIRGTKLLESVSTGYPFKLQFCSQKDADNYQLAFWITNGVIDILTQSLIGLAPIYLLFNLQISVAHKRLAMVAFMPNMTYASSSGPDIPFLCLLSAERSPFLSCALYTYVNILTPPTQQRTLSAPRWSQ